MKVLKPALQNIDQLIISVRVRGHQEKPILQHEIPCITDNPFNHLAVIKINPHPQPLNDRRMFMKVQSPVAKIPIEGLHKEDRFGILGWNVFDRLRIKQLKPNRAKRILRIVSQKLLYRPKFTRLRQTPNCMVFIPNNHPVNIGRPTLGLLDVYA